MRIHGRIFEETQDLSKPGRNYLSYFVYAYLDKVDGEKITTSISYKDSARLIEKPTDENKISGILILLIGFIVLISQKKSEEEYLDGTQKELVNSRNLMPAKRYKSKLYIFQI